MRATSSILFLISGIVAVLVAPVKVVAVDRLMLLAAGLLAGWALLWLTRNGGRSTLLGWVALSSAWMAGALGAYYLLVHDFAKEGQGEDFGLLARLGLALQEVRPTTSLGDDINSNVLASGLVVLIPLGIGGLLWVLRSGRSGEEEENPPRRNQWARIAVVALCVLPLGVALVALLLSSSRGGWLGLGVGVICGTYLMIRRGLGRRRRWRTWWPVADALLLAMLGLIAALFVLALVFPGFTGPLGGAMVGGAAGSRAALWRDALAVIDDYRYTGAGLGSTMMVLSTYVYLLHVGFITHVHNLYLEIAVEQGLVGLVAFLFLVGTAVAALIQALRYRHVPSVLIGGATASLVAMLVHGLVDAGLYASRLAPLLFLPIGFAWALEALAHRHAYFSYERLGRNALLAATPLAAVALLFALPGARGAFQANLGAVSQTGVELSTYSWPAWPIQDALRRSPAVDLQPAITRYAAALVRNPEDATAHRRLGQIALSRGVVAEALAHLETAYRLAPDHRATRLLLGEAYVLSGQIDQAAELYRTVNNPTDSVIQGRRWWISQVGTEEQQAWFDEASKRGLP